MAHFAHVSPANDMKTILFRTKLFLDYDRGSNLVPLAQAIRVLTTELLPKVSVVVVHFSSEC